MCQTIYPYYEKYKIVIKKIKKKKQKQKTNIKILCKKLL